MALLAFGVLTSRRGGLAFVVQHRDPVPKATMPSVSLRQVLEAFDFMADDMTTYVDPTSGEVLAITHEEYSILKSGETPASTPEWMKEMIANMRGVDLDALIPLPDKFDVHEWDIMRRFSSEVSSELQRDALLDAIHGPGAFRNFRREVERLRLRDDWFAFRHQALKAIAVEWANEHGLAYVDDA